jgi:DNA polymerase elongation subunit (family B)
MEKSNFYSYSWYCDEKEEEITSIRIYGLNEKNENVCLRVDDFTPYVYIELPDNIPWTSARAQLVGETIDELLGDQKPLSKVLTMKHRLYRAHMDENGKRKLFPYLFCKFSSVKDIKVLGFKLKRSLNVYGMGIMIIKMHEADASPILQLTCCRDIPTSGWMTVHGKLVAEIDKLTSCDHEYKVRWKNLFPDKKNTAIPKPKIMGFDMEVNSTIPSSFPKAERPGDVIFQISCVFAREGDKPEDYEKYLLTLGEPDQETTGDDVLIYMYNCEHDLLCGFADLIREENPNVISGYNILGFDIPYLIKRAASPNMCIQNVSKIGFHKYNMAPVKPIKWSSKAYGNQEFQYLDAEGRLFLDLLPLVKRDYKMSNYKLKTVSTEFLGQTKDPLSVKGIFKCYKIGITKNKQGEFSTKAQKAMGVVGKYCIQDTVLVLRLMNYLQTWVGLAEMATVCNVPMFTLYTQGQQVKVYAQLYKYCMFNNFVVEKDSYKVGANERYVGAKVYPPITGRHSMVVPFDFASLYPTTIIAYNIDYSTWVTDPNVPDSKCHVMDWHDHISCEHDPKIIRKMELIAYITVEEKKIKDMRDKRNKKTTCKYRKKEMMDEIKAKVAELKPYKSERSEINKTKSKFPMCEKRYYRFLKEPKGVMPTVIERLLDARRNTRKEIKVNKATIKKLKNEVKEPDDEPSKEIEKLNGLISVLNKRQLAYKVSANSVSSVTPIPCQIDGKFVYRTVEELSQEDWKSINTEQEISTPINNLLVWSDKGFTKPKYIMRHIQEKSLKRIITHTGFVDCTDEHSLLTPEGVEVKPSNLNVKDELMHHSYPLPEDTPNKPLFRSISNETIQNYPLINKDEEMAFLHGLFFAEGTCGIWGNLGKAKSSWIIYNQDYKLLVRARDILNKYEGEFTISKFYESASVYHLKPIKTIKPLCDIYRSLFYNKRKYKIVPDYILLAPFNIRQSFFMGYCSGDGNRNIKVGVIINNKGQIGTASLMYLSNSLGYNVSISNGKNGDIYRLQCCTEFRNKNTKSIKSITTSCQSEPIQLTQPKIIRNDEHIYFEDNISSYRNIKILCNRFPRQTLLNSLDTAINCAQERYSYVTEYNTKGKKIIYKKYCCGKKYSISIQILKQKHLDRNNCKCDQTNKINKLYNTTNVYIETEYKEYVYDIETENHHFAAGIGHMIVHNSMYGIMGVRQYGVLPFMPGAMCTTYMGRVNIGIVAKKIPNEYGGKLIYGDSVTEDTPILCKIKGKICYRTIDNLPHSEWTDYHGGKEISNPDNIEVWTENGFTKVNKIIKHKTRKEIFRVLTHTGVVDVTEDHGLLNINSEKVSPKELTVGSDLLISDLPIYKTHEDIFTKDQAYIMGLFYADGSCGIYKYNNKEQSTWEINNQNRVLLEKCSVMLNNIYDKHSFKILETIKSSNMLKLVLNGKNKKDFVSEWRTMMYDKNKYKKMPDEILWSSEEIRQSFLDGYYASDGDKDKNGYYCFDNKGKIGAAGLYYLATSLGYYVSINTRKDKPNIYRLTCTKNKQRKCPHKVKKIYSLGFTEQFVYDLETKNHHFSAGIGKLIVHNTDSNYICFPHLKTATETWDYALHVAAEVTKLFPVPICLEFEEEIYDFFFILSKKRYMYQKCDRDGKIDKNIGNKGVLLTRRDNCNYVRGVYRQGITEISLDISEDDILYNLILKMNKMCSNTIPYEEFVVTKSSGDYGGLMSVPFTNEKGQKKAKVGDYTVPLLSSDPDIRQSQLDKKGAANAREFNLLCLPGQVQLAERMKVRGTPIGSGSRIEYVVTDKGGHKAKQYEKVESADYYKKYSSIINLDNFYYLKALTTPVDQLLNVAYKDNPKFKKDFVLNQYKFRWNIRRKMLDELKSLFAPKLVFEN